MTRRLDIMNIYNKIHRTLMAEFIPEYKLPHTISINNILLEISAQIKFD